MSATTQTKTLGSLDFVRMIYEGHPEYSLLAVKAPITEVVGAFIEFRESQSTRTRRDFRSMTVKTDKVANRTIQWHKNIALWKRDRYAAGSAIDRSDLSDCHCTA